VLDPNPYFQSLIQTAANGYGSSLSGRRFTFLSESSRHYLLQEATGVLMESLFFDLASKLGITQIIECGAHDAATSIRFTSKEGTSALAIEANPYVHEKYKAKFANSRIDYRSMGVSNSTTTLEMNIPKHHSDDTSLEGSLHKRKDFNSYRTVSIQVDRLDNIAKEFIQGGLTCIWIDVEGLGGKVIEGANQILENTNVRLIYIEVQDDQAYYEEESSAIEIARQLANFGFVPIARDYPVANLYNLLFIKVDDLGTCTTVLSKFWVQYSNLKVPYFRKRSTRDILALTKKYIFRPSKSGKPKGSDYLFAKLGSKSSKQRILDWNKPH
jgi:FkbM family methyltransferase